MWSCSVTAAAERFDHINNSCHTTIDLWPASDQWAALLSLEIICPSVKRVGGRIENKKATLTTSGFLVIEPAVMLPT
jgi:hypothetical protein